MNKILIIFVLKIFLKILEIGNCSSDVELITLSTHRIEFSFLQGFLNFYVSKYDFLLSLNAPKARFDRRTSRSVLYSSHTYKFISCNVILKLKSIFYH